MTAALITQAYDDVGPQVGATTYGGYTNDTAPVVRVSLGDQAAGSTVQLTDNGQAIGVAVTLTADNLSQGFIDIAVAGLGEGWNLLAATLTSPDGATSVTTPSFALGVATATPAAPIILGADDDVGASVGSLSAGARTDDATPTFHVSEAGLPPIPQGSPGHAPYGGPALMGGRIELYENGQRIGDAVIGYGGQVAITSGTLSAGDHLLTARAVDRAGNVSPLSDPFRLTVGPDAALQPGPAAPTNPGEVLHTGPGLLDLLAGSGDDTITGANLANSIRGGSGDDSITGGLAYNEVNGNQGADTIVARSLVGDSLMGGQGDDLIDARAASGHDSINGNRGDDVIYGGSGGDLLWGGQGDDQVIGGAGRDFISGDLGENTLTGGAGADIFHGKAGGHDLVTDFRTAAGDRVQIDEGVGYSVSQLGADTVIEITGGGRMVLAGVDHLSLASGWIFQA